MKKEDSASSGVNNFGLASVVFGVISIIVSLALPVMGSPTAVLLGIVGLVFGIIQYRISRNKWAITGIILSLLGIIIGALILVFFVSSIVSLLNSPEYQQALEQARQLQESSQALQDYASLTP